MHPIVRIQQTKYAITIPIIPEITWSSTLLLMIELMIMTIIVENSIISICSREVVGYMYVNIIVTIIVSVSIDSSNIASQRLFHRNSVPIKYLNNVTKMSNANGNPKEPYTIWSFLSVWEMSVFIFPKSVYCFIVVSLFTIICIR